MLKLLTINNYALIHELELEFTDGLTVITGETGAGKSIMLGALSLILGERADTSVIFDKKAKCVIEGKFDVRKYDLKPFFTTNDLDYFDHAILRREMSPNGRSRAFINDTPVNLQEMKDLGEKLLNIHSQNETIILNDSSFQMAIVDSYAKTNNELKEYQLEFKNHKNFIKELSGLKEKERKAKADQDYFQFQIDELNAAGLKDNEQSELENELKLLNNSEEIKSLFNELINILDNTDFAVINSLKNVISGISKLKGINEEIDDIIKRMNSLLIETQDISQEAFSIEEKVVIDHGKLEEVTERLDNIYSLQQKHGVSNNAELIELLSDFEKRISDIVSLENEINKLEKELKKSTQDLKKRAAELSEKRLGVIPQIEKEIIGKISLLGMKGAEFSIKSSTLEDFGKDGIDSILFLFNANRGGELQKISKVASGGELSRLMLAMKSMIAKENLIPTIIFDEIDSGVSGDIAGKVGSILKSMGEFMQVIAITHLPQIAGMGIAHYKVYKEMDEAKTYSRIKLLNSEERIDEMAQLISGERITQQAIDAARELLLTENKN